MRRKILGLSVAVLIAMALPSVAYAADDNYTPVNPTTPTLAGSSAVADCEADAPWITYSITLTDPESQATSHSAVLFMTNGTSSLEIPLADLTDNRSEGRVLWPGASVDSSGNANGWPGWAFENGQWVETTGNFAWTRGNITAQLRVNPELTVPLSYPEATPSCVAGPRVSGSATSLPATGLSAAVLPIGIVGGAVVIAGAVLLILRRRAHR